MSLVFVGDRCNDHSQSSGYDQLCSLFPDAAWLSGRALEAGEFLWHREPRDTSVVTNCMFHVIYGDCSGKSLPRILRTRFPGAKIVATLHRPTRYLMADPIALAALRAIDAVVTVSEVQAEELRRSQLPVPIYSIPHGVWTRVFRPRSMSDKRPRRDVLVVGSFLRDWEGTKQVLEALASFEIPTFALGAGARENLGGQDLAIKVLPRIPEAELVKMYHQSAAVFLPFLEATASNALLESMAAGCPVICPRFPSLGEYLQDDTDLFEPGHHSVAVSRILYYAHNPSAREGRGRRLMAQAEAFDWSRVGERYAMIYDEIGRIPADRSGCVNSLKT